MGCHTCLSVCLSVIALQQSSEKAECQLHMLSRSYADKQAAFLLFFYATVP